MYASCRTVWGLSGLNSQCQTGMEAACNPITGETKTGDLLRKQTSKTRCNWWVSGSAKDLSSMNGEQSNKTFSVNIGPQHEHTHTQTHAIAHMWISLHTHMYIAHTHTHAKINRTTMWSSNPVQDIYLKKMNCVCVSESNYCIHCSTI